MTWKITPKEIEAVSKLSSEKRYHHFIKKVADTQELWSLYDNGWALAGDDDGNQIFPLWPAAEYAEISAITRWKEFKPKKITLEEFFEDVLPDLKEEKILLGIFFNSEGQGIVISVDDFLPYLQEELDKY